MDSFDFVNCIPTSATALRLCKDRRTGLVGFVLGSDAYSKFFRGEFLSFLETNQIDPEQISISDILISAYLSFLLCSVSNNHNLLVIGEISVAVAFAAKCARRVIFVIGAPTSAHPHPIALDRAGLIKIIENIEQLPDGSLQQIVSLNSWRHEGFMDDKLLKKLSPSPLISTLVCGTGVQFPRSGPATRKYFKISATATVDTSAPDDEFQSFLSIAVLNRAGNLEG